MPPEQIIFTAAEAELSSSFARSEEFAPRLPRKPATRTLSPTELMLAVTDPRAATRFTPLPNWPLTRSISLAYAIALAKVTLKEALKP
jgi:hypothetical protein